jgi:2-polyprenyl-6-methoxyphenol hydroxylase-like FAD-dependent oxidoreductase
MLGYLLARAGVPVTVLEKHGDFFRDFRGDTVHPSTLEILYELDLLNDFLKVPHQRVTSAGGAFGDFEFQGPYFRHVPAHCKFVALMPQWDFLNFLSTQARRFPTFDLRMRHEAVDLMHEDERIVGVIARGEGDSLVRIRAELVIGSDGRHSVVRTAGQLEVEEVGVPNDVLWFRVRRCPDDPEQVLGTINFGKALILIDRGDYFQAGLIIRKGGFDEIKRGGLDAFRAGILQLAPYFETRVNELQDWEQVKLLTVQINRLKKWYRPGLLCIGDAAHAMSPAGGVGINLAIQDAVATANLLAGPLQHRTVSDEDLAGVQRRREFPARATQAAQVRIHDALARVFANPGPVSAPWQLRVAVRIPGIHRALGYAVGIGVRPEHIRAAVHSHVPSLSRFGIAIGRAVGTMVAIFGPRRRSASRTGRLGSTAVIPPSGLKAGVYPAGAAS